MKVSLTLKYYFRRTSGKDSKKINRKIVYFQIKLFSQQPASNWRPRTASSTCAGRLSIDSEAAAAGRQKGRGRVEVTDNRVGLVCG